MKTISLNNFLKMSPDAPQYTEKNQHYLISGANPTYYNDSAVSGSAVQEEQLAPLIASNTWHQSANLGSVSISDITEDTKGTYSCYLIDGNSLLRGLNLGSDIAYILSQPNGTEVATTQHIKCFVGNMLAITSGSTGKFWTTSLPVTNVSNWVGHTGLTVSVPQFLELFLEYCMVSDNISAIKKIDSSFNVLTGIDLGTGWTILGMKNYNDKYLAIAASQGSYNNNYLFLWNGRDNEPNYSVKISGKFLDMKVINGTLYIAVQEQGAGSVIPEIGKTSIYYLKGYQLVEVFTPQISMIRNDQLSKSTLFNLENRLGINLKSTDLMIYAGTPAGPEEFVISTGLSFYKFSETSDNYIVAIANDVYGNPYAYYYNYGSTLFNTISYKSHWIPVKNLQGIDIWYDTPPQSGTDAINVTIYGDGQDIIAGTQTITLDSITPTNFLNQKRTRLDVKGFAGDKVKIVLTTVNSGSWRPLIRGIDLILA